MYNILDAFLMFFLYSFLGWCMEIGYNGITEGHYVNRGFLNGPVCPIYGVGGTLVVLCLTPLKSNIVFLFSVSVILCTVIEFITGWVLFKLYKTRWWDYSDKKFNVGGFICLQFSVGWGFACIGLMYFLHPLLYDTLIYKAPTVLKVIAVIVLGVTFITDLIATVITLKHLRIRADNITDIGEKLLEVSKKIGVHVYDGAIKAETKYIEAENSYKMIELKAKYEELKIKYDELISKRSVMQEHLLKAFKNARSEKYGDAFIKLRDKIAERKNHR